MVAVGRQAPGEVESKQTSVRLASFSGEGSRSMQTQAIERSRPSIDWEHLLDASRHEQRRSCASADLKRTLASFV
jgi:hypothetical protein